MLALSLAMALAALDTGAFFGAAFTAGFAAFSTFAGAATFWGAYAALGAAFFAVAIFRYPYVVVNRPECFWSVRIVATYRRQCTPNCCAMFTQTRTHCGAAVRGANDRIPRQSNQHQPRTE